MPSSWFHFLKGEKGLRGPHCALRGHVSPAFPAVISWESASTQKALELGHLPATFSWTLLQALLSLPGKEPLAGGSHR